MKNSKLFKYLDALHSSDWREMLQYFKGSVGENNDAYKLFNHIYGFRKSLSHKKLEIAFVNTSLFSHLSRKSFQNIMSVLVREIEEYWIWKDLKQDKVRREVHRLEALNSRGLYHESKKSLDVVFKLTDNTNHLDLWNDSYRVRALFKIYFSNNPIKDNSELVKFILSKSIESISSSTINLLEYFQAEFYNRQLNRSEDWKSEIDFIRMINLRAPASVLSTSLSDQTDLLSKNYSFEPLALLGLLKNESISITPSIKIAFFYHIRRYYIIQVRGGNKSYVSDLLQLIKWSIDSGLLLFHDELEISYFISDMNVLCALKEVEEANLYMNKYLDKLHPEDVEEGRSLGEMIINFVLGKYDAVSDLYVRSTFKKPSRRLQAAGLFLRASYELRTSRDFNFDYYLRNVSDFIRRNERQLSVQQVQGWKNFIYLLKRMNKGTDEHELLTLLEKSKDIIHRKWLESSIKKGGTK